MGSHIARLGEGLIAIWMWTDIGFATSVVVQVGLQVVLLGEGLGAQGAAKRLNSRMEAMVQSHVAAIGKGFSAHRALIGFLPTVSSHVLF